MFFFKNIGIWCILFTLLETTKQLVLLKEDNLHSLEIPYDTGILFDKDEIPYPLDYKHNIDDYVQKYAPFQRGGEMQEEYDDYRDEKESPNFSKGGLGLFSWWKNEAESKRLKGATYPPVANEITTPEGNSTVDAAVMANATAIMNVTGTINVTATVSETGTINASVTMEGNATLNTNTTVDPAAVSSDSDDNLTSTYLTTCVCYNVTEECIPLVIATGVTCLGLEEDRNTTATSSMNEDNTTIDSSSITTTSSENTTAASSMSGSILGQNTTSTQSMNGSTPDLHTTVAVAALSGSTAGLNTTSSLVINGTTVSQNQKTSALNAQSTMPTGNASNTGITSSIANNSSVTNAITEVSMPTGLNMFGAGVFLPIYEIPMTPLLVINTTPPSPTKKKKTFHRTDHDRNPFQPTELQLNDFPSDQMPLSENYANNNSSMLNRIPYTVLGSNDNKPPLIPDQKKKFVVENRIASPNNMVPIRHAVVRNNPFSVNKVATQNVENGVMIGPQKSFLDPSQKMLINNPISLDRKSTFSNNKMSDLIQNHRTEELSHEPNNLFQNTLIVKDYSNSPIVIPGDTLKTQTSQFPVNDVVLSNNIQTEENKLVPNVKNFPGYFVKYNDTYLSENSNMSVNLVDLCKNVTCQGSSYLSQCCGRVFGPEKCQGEDFSYLHPIPGYFSTTVNTTYKQYDPFLLTMASKPEAPTVANAMQQLVIDKYTTQYTTIINCSCSSKPKINRIVRENNMNDFVKFQLMHGITNPDGKEMMNALKEASLEIQKINREFHSNDPGNIFQMNRNGQNIHLPIIDNHRLSKKEPEVVLPFSSNKVLDDLRATISNSLLQSNLKSSPYQKDRYRFIRNQGLKDQMESIRENSMILEKIKKETEVELQRLYLLETKRREDELLFDRKRENELKKLKTIQDLIHKEFDLRLQGDCEKRGLSDKPHTLIKQYEPTKKGSKISKEVKNVDSSSENGIDNFIMDKYSSLDSNTSKNFKPSSNLVDIDKFPELEINNAANIPHDETLLLLNIGLDKESLSEKQRRRRQSSNIAKNKILKENIKSVHSTENNTGLLR